METNLSSDLIKEVFERDNFTCKKCGFRDLSKEGLKIHTISLKEVSKPFEINNLVTLCSICYKHAPESEKEFKKYLLEKIDSKLLETFRKSDYSISKKTKTGMENSFKKGNHITKAPLGYKLVNKQLIVDETQINKVKSIFEEYLNSSISLTQLAKKNSFTTRGIKKLLQNTTYIGKVKFANKEIEGQHQAIIGKEVFNKVQEKLK